jgi:hypothetical protein
MTAVDKYAKFMTEQNKQLVTRGHLNEAKETYTHEIDVHPHGWAAVTRKAHEQGTDAMVSKLKKQGFHAKVATYHGPGGGAAVLHIGHPKGRAHVDKWIKRVYDPDHEIGDTSYSI